MNGIHDMGGMHGFGPIVREENAPVFHHDWEERVFAIRIATTVSISGGSRNNIEQMDQAVYLTTGYYERWLETLEKLAIARGLVTLDELDTRTAAYTFSAHHAHED